MNIVNLIFAFIIGYVVQQLVIKLYNIYKFRELNKGIKLFGQLKYKESLKFFKNEIKNNPKDIHGYFYRGLTYLYLYRYEKAIEDYNTCIKINPNDSNSYQNRGISYFFLKEYKKSLDDLKKAYSLCEDNKQLFHIKNFLGDSNIECGNYKDALEDYNSVLKNEKDPYIYLKRSFVNLELNNINQCISDYNNAISLNPKVLENDLYNKEKLKKIQNLISIRETKKL